MPFVREWKHVSVHFYLLFPIKKINNLSDCFEQAFLFRKLVYEVIGVYARKWLLASESVTVHQVVFILLIEEVEQYSFTERYWEHHGLLPLQQSF